MQDSPPDEWLEAKEQLDEKDLLMRIAFGIDELNQRLAQLNGNVDTEADTDTVDNFVCLHCGNQITKGKRESHAKSCANWHEDMGDVSRHYEVA